MTDAEQVACDALRSAGLDELADNLAFAREAVRLRAWLPLNLQDSDGDCRGCGEYFDRAHLRTCGVVPMLATQSGWLEAERNRAHAEAIRENEWLHQPAAQLAPGVTVASSPLVPNGEVWAYQADLSRWLPTTTLVSLRRDVPGLVARVEAYNKRTK